MLSYLSISSTRRHQIWFLVGGDLGTGIGPYPKVSKFSTAKVVYWLFFPISYLFSTYHNLQNLQLAKSKLTVCCGNMTSLQILPFLNFALGILDDFIGSSGVCTPDLQLTQKHWSLRWWVFGGPSGWYVVQLWDGLASANFQQIYRPLHKCHPNHRNPTLTTCFSFALEILAAVAPFNGLNLHSGCHSLILRVQDFILQNLRFQIHFS